MKYTIDDIGKITGATFLQSVDPNHYIEELLIDSRTIRNTKGLFFALPGNLKDGHNYIGEAYQKGIRNFIVSQSGIEQKYKDANFLLIENVLLALQRLSIHHRNKFPQLKVIGITGSNGKTVVKEWLNTLLYDKYHIVKSPKSYNSQIGVPLSIWQINIAHNLGIFEAGISTQGEMDGLERIIQPTIGVLTNIGPAHDLGFPDMENKVVEKLKLFKHVDVIICNTDSLKKAGMERSVKMKVWGYGKEANLFTIQSQLTEGSTSRLQICLNENLQILDLILPFTDAASIENALHCLAICLVINVSIEDLLPAFTSLTALPMRLEMKAGIGNSMLINDAYSSDLASLTIALEYLNQQKGNRTPMVILSDFLEATEKPSILYANVTKLLDNHNISDIITVGKLSSQIHIPGKGFRHFENTADLMAAISSVSLENKAILIKGARPFGFEKIFEKLSSRGHSASLEINLEAMDHNLSVYSSFLNPETMIMAVIKASAYGSGSDEMAHFLSHRRVNYLAVAFADEGIHLREAGIKLPIVVLNPDSASIPDMLSYGLEPEVYDILQLQDICDFLGKADGSHLKIHLKVDTGMHRLGFQSSEMDAVIDLLKKHQKVEVKSIFSHLSSSEDSNDDDYSQQQFITYDHVYNYITNELGYHPLRHILNTAGIVRFRDRQYDMVRLGLGLYGIDTSKEVKDLLQKAHTLRAQILQVKTIKEGSYVGYNRKMKAEKAMKIAIVNIGYADGLLRGSGNQKYAFSVADTLCPIIGNVNMDLTIIDVTSVEKVQRGDDAIIFGKDLPVETLAQINHTIPYEILSRIAPRIKRIYTRG